MIFPKKQKQNNTSEYLKKIILLPNNLWVRDKNTRPPD